MRYVCGDTLFDTWRDELTHAGELVPLERQARRVLQYLLQHRDRVVPSQELLAQLWPNTHVSPSVLTRCIRLVRQALGDTAQQQRRIKTVHGVGYRCMMDVIEQHHAEPPRAAAQQSLPASSDELVDSTASLQATEAMGEARLLVTVVAASVVDAAFMRQQPPDETGSSTLATILTHVHALMGQYGGYMQTFDDEGCLALFGALTPQEDHAWQALLAADAMLQQLPALADSGLIPPTALALRLGVHSGWVMGHRLEEETRRLFAPFGDTMSMARRLQQQAPPTTILVSAATARLQRGEAQLVRWRATLPAQAADASPIYRLISVVPQRARLAHRAGRRRSPLVGRSQELALLDSRLHQAQNGHGQVVHLTAEAGLGKSRLVTEAADAWIGQGSRVIMAAGQPYETVAPHLPLRSLLRQALGLTEADNDAGPEAALRRCSDLGLNLHATPHFFELLGYPSAPPPVEMLYPETHTAQLLTTANQIFFCLAQRAPLVLAIEDLHWCDQMTEAFCAKMVDQLAGAPLLLVTTSRPPHQPSWLAKSYVTQLALPPLDAQESAAIVHATAGAEALSDAMVQAMVAQAAGNPLFLEELAAALATTEHGQRPAAVPETLHGVLLARLHRLPESLQRLLMTAAVLGQTWPQALLASIWPEPVALESLLDMAQQHEALYLNPAAGARDYSFKHPLLQQAAYGRLSTAQRQGLHARAGQALEAQYAGRLEERYEQLAYHYAQTTEHDKAVAYLAAYAAQALRRQAHADAAAACQQALRHAERLPEPTRLQRSLRLVLQLTHAWSFLGRFPDSCALLERCQPQVDARSEDALTGPFYFRLGRTYSLLGQQTRAKKATRQALVAARRCGDRATLGLAAYELGRELMLSAPPKSALRYGRQAVRELHRLGEQWWLGMAYWLVGAANGFLGNFAAALEAATQAQGIGETLHDPHVQSYAALTTGWIEAMRGHGNKGVRLCRRALALAADPVNKAHAAGALGYAYLEQNQGEKALPYLEQAVAAWRQFQLRPMQGWFTAVWAQAQWAIGRRAEALALAQEALDISQATGFPFAIGVAQRVLGQISLATTDLEQAGIHLQAALETLSNIEARFEQGRAHLALAALAHTQSQDGVLDRHLLEALALFRTISAPRCMARVRQQARAYGTSRLSAA